ncbi:MAG TPA: hypothetical protein PKN13_03720 [Accumulibacter sp.]|nr:hypothetical protein [Accumulibacter sp.]HMW18938.1 hypothetical protein [Accumulibacter sp.]HMX21809.1 hypothetical protein [Accumulibacter sp.]HMY07019.1 hypothetical protein [Accumulibacter sp.]HNC16821.1 hypothetical protein [Accumulibacter sp.]
MASDVPAVPAGQSSSVAGSPSTVNEVAAIGLKSGDWATALPGLAAVAILLIVVLLRRRGILVEQLTRRSTIDSLSQIVDPVARAGDAASPLTAATLEQLPEICERVVALWGQPACRVYLEEILQQGRVDPQRCLSLPVVQEILFLIDLMAVREAG